MYEDAIEHLELDLENLYHDMSMMNREELESYTERIYIKLYSIQYKNRVKEAEERYWSHVDAVYQPH